MEFGAATATLSKKLSNGYGVSGKSAYDGVLATPIKFRAHGFSSRFEDYREIFGGSEASLGSSIPILEVPELNERSNLDDRRCSKLDYSTVFGGFENLDAAVPYEELFAEPRKKVSSHKEARSLAKVGKQISKEEHTDCSKEDPLAQETSLAGTRKVNMSYRKLSLGSENRTNGTTHIAQLHAVPGYTRLIEEVNPPKVNRADQPVPVVQDAYLSSGCEERIKESGHRTESVTAASPDGNNKQSCNGGSKAHNRSHSIHLFFDSPVIRNESNGTKFNEVSSSFTVIADSDNHNGDAVRSMATKCQIPKPDVSQRANGADSPSYDDMVDLNSEAAVSVAALRKAIEEAQERINVAKESMKRKKEGLHDCVKRRFNNDLKSKEKKENKLTSKTMRVEEINMRQTFREMDTSPLIATEIGKPMMRAEQVTLDFSAKQIFGAADSVREAQMKSKLTEVEHKMEEVEWKEADCKVTVIESKQEDNDKEVLHTTDDYQRNDKNTGSNVLEKPELFVQKTKVIKQLQEQETNEGNVGADIEACRCEHVVDENENGSKEIVDETKLAQQTLNYETEDKRLEVNQYKEDTENKVGPVLVPEDCERKHCDGGLVFNMEDAETNGEGCSELEECQCNLSAHEESVVIEHKIAQEQKSGEKVQVTGELDECELSELLEPLDNEKDFNLECSELKSKERQIENLRCVEDQNISNEAGFLDINQEIEHSFGRAESENSFGNMEEIRDDIHGEEEIQERLINNSESDGNEKPLPATEIDKEVEGASNVVEENKKGKHENSEQAEPTKVTETGPKSEEEKTNEAVKSVELSSMYKPDDETEHSNKIQEADISVENDETQEITSEHDELDNIIKASNACFRHEEKYEEPEAVQETYDLGERHTLEASAFTLGSFELDEDINQVRDKNGIVAFDSTATRIHETVIKVEQDEDQCLKEAKNDGNLTRHIEEATLESDENYRDAKEVELTLNEEINETQCAFSDEEKLVNDECNGETSQLPSMPEWKSYTFKDHEIKMNHNNLKENQQANPTMEEKKANGTSQKVVLEKEHTRKIDEAKEREREREKEKLAVERAIREARERAFAEARERASLERAAAEARRKNMSDGRERVGKTTGQATEKATMEAKLKAERAAVERATAEARARALERALSEKAASVARNKSENFLSEKSDSTSRDNGTKHKFYTRSFSYGDEFDGVNGDSAQRCKARSERHQRIGERVAKALAEKNMRDRLVQKEQEERNRVAETLDADVKRWSSGKEGNLRALLSTLQYILGPDSGWQSIPLTDIVTATAVKKAYRKATLFVHPDKLQQRGATIQQKYTCEKVFDLLKEAWNKFNMEER